MTRQEFVTFVENECKKNDVRFYLGHGRELNLGEGARASGYFDGERLAIPNHSDCWFPTLIHEYSHMTRFLKDGRKFPKLSDLELELDCEKRAVKIVNKYQLPINLNVYIPQANAYVMSYGIYENPFDFLRKNPTEVRKVWSKMPLHFLRKSEYENPPQWFKEAVEKYCL